MKAILAGAVLAVAITTAGAAEDTNSANFWMPLLQGPSSRRGPRRSP
jgi:hypothetical protein